MRSGTKTVTASPQACSSNDDKPHCKKRIATALLAALAGAALFGAGPVSQAQESGGTWVTLSGDWDGDGVHTPGLYNRTTSRFFLYEANAAGGAFQIISFGQANWWPVVGDWDGDGIDTIGVYNPNRGRFFLRARNDTNDGRRTFRFGKPGRLPIAGDWDGDGADTVGVYNPTTALAELQARLGRRDISAKFQYGQSGWLPVAGDWDGNGVDSLGVYNPDSSRFFLRNDLSSGPSDHHFVLGPTRPGSTPVAGRWTDTSSGLSDSVGAFGPADFTLVLASVPGAGDMSFRLDPELGDQTPSPEPTVPTAPSDLSATAPSPSRVDLSWSDRSDDEIRFELHRRRSSDGGTFGMLATLDADTSAYRDTQVSDGIEYCYRVRAANAVGNSAFSADRCVTTPVANQAPVALNDFFTVTQDSSDNTLDVTANDSDPNPADTIRTSNATSSGSGSVGISGNRLTYTPAGGFHGIETVSYTIEDDSGATDSATVTITVSPTPNQAPVALDDAFTVPYGSTANALAVLANDADPDSEDSLTITQASSNGSGTVVIAGGQINYTPATGFHGTELLSYTAGDGRGATDSAEVTVTVSAPPPPEPKEITPPSGLSATADGDALVTLNWSPSPDSTVAGYRIYRDGNPTPIASTSGTSYSDTGVTADKNYTYHISAVDGEVPPTESALSTPASARTAAASVWVGGDVGTVAIAGSHSESVDTIALTVASRDIWYGEDQFHFVSQTWNGDGEIVARVGSLTNTHAWAKAGVMIREQSTSESAHAFMALTPGNGAAFHWRPSAGETTRHRAGPQVAAPHWIRLNREGDVFTGYVSADGTNWIRVHSATFPMAASVRVGLALSSHNEAATATAEFDNVSIGVGTEPGPDTVVPAQPSSLAVAATAFDRIQVTWADQSDNETGFDLQRAGPAAGGSFNTIASPGANTQSYADTGVTGGSEFCYRIRARNAAGSSAFSEVRCATPPLANQAPAARDDTYTVTQDSTGVLLAVLSNDTDPDAGDSLRIVEATANQGTVTISGSQLSYSPQPGFAGDDSVVYVVEDQAGARDTATAAITIPARPDARPIANTDAVSIEMNAQTVIRVLSNDTGLEDGPISVSLLQNPSAGTASVAADGSILYQPGTGYIGTDSLSYRVTDNDGDSAVSTVGIEVSCSTCPNQSNLVLSWDPSSGQVDGYRIYYGPTPDTAIVEISDLETSNSELDPDSPSKRYDVDQDLGLTAGEQGCFRVRAYNVFGVSAVSESACAQL